MTHLLLPTRTFIQVFVDQKILEQAGSLSGRIRVYLKKQSFTKNNVLKRNNRNVCRWAADHSLETTNHRSVRGSLSKALNERDVTQTSTLTAAEVLLSKALNSRDTAALINTREDEIQ